MLSLIIKIVVFDYMFHVFSATTAVYIGCPISFHADGFFAMCDVRSMFSVKCDCNHTTASRNGPQDGFN